MRYEIQTVLINAVDKTLDDYCLHGENGAKTQSGYLVLADISGFTLLCRQTNDHAHAPLLPLETIMEKISNLLTIFQLEGDAVFAYAEESQLQEGKSLLQLIDQTYLAFRDRALELYAGATCPCRACKALPKLDLKFMVHHGEFIIRQVAGVQHLLGTDVNLLHRLSKNQVAESTGWKGYALFTNQGMEHMQTDKRVFENRIVRTPWRSGNHAEICMSVMKMKAPYPRLP
jgi:hypothetical protein